MIQKFGFLLSLSLAFSTAGATGAKIQNIDPQGGVQRDRGGALSPLHENDRLEPQDAVVTDSKSSAEIFYEGGSSQVVAPASRLTILPPEEGAPSAQLEEGTTVIQVPKNSESKKHKFFLRTKTAVMGVRGTLFVVEAGKRGGATTLHTVEGSVEIATDPKILREGRGVRVSQNEMLQARQGSLGPKNSFRPEPFLQQLKSSNPRGAQMIRREMSQRPQGGMSREGGPRSRSDSPKEGRREQGEEKRREKSGPGSGQGNDQDRRHGPGSEGPRRGGGPGAGPGAGGPSGKGNGPGSGGRPGGGGPPPPPSNGGNGPNTQPMNPPH